MGKQDRVTMIRRWFLAVVTFGYLSVGNAAELHGVSMPDVRVTNGVPLQLNGIGLRTYSIFKVPIYVAGLYLERRSNNPDAILHSPETKLLNIRFLRDVSVEAAQNAWREGFENNCKGPCHLNPDYVQRFLAAVPPIREGDETMLLFTANGVNVTINGRPTGNITDPQFAYVILATFIGAEPPTPRLKRELLGGPH
jgi:long-chain acyl-CoA synthetase